MNMCLYYVEIKGKLDATDGFLLQNLLFAQHISGTIMRDAAASRKPDSQPTAPHQNDNL